ncbi:GAF domain-containing protein [Mucilaginibacter conchicola]|uniref:histidine kinase n=1 Tax=Mucilaginibacter conchicola TaxID=2303333 RepID=A0A372NMA4_9SPHI|nr:GAF domain-containing sensor histidine kinase [Mucilaginibacter conchicola]RFZ90076.1 GAF domain-containing protein [Mucilaginibacter conchicola]
MPQKQELDFSADVAAVQRIPVIDELLSIICRTTGMGFAAVARVTEDRWIACATHDEVNFGLEPGGELKVDTTICHEIRQHRDAVAFDSVLNDPRYADHHTPKIYGLKSYISVPLFLKNGHFFGTLCAIDPQSHRVNNPETLGMFRFYAELIAFHLDAIDRLERSEARLAEERQIAELREQFIAILGHDLRNPVGAINNVAQLMLRMPLDDRMRRLAHILRDSSFRMRELIENVLDFARGKLGEGIILDRQDVSLDEPIRLIISELELSWPERKVELELQNDLMVTVDVKRIMQLFSNLLSNALTHGAKDQPVVVSAKVDDKQFSLSVCNAGQPIPEVLLKNLFQPFSRGKIKPGQQGLGLGLFIAAEIAKAHSGELAVSSNDEATCFTLTIPLG